MDFDVLAQMIIAGDHRGAARWTEEAVAAGVGPREILDRALIPGMDEVGRRFKEDEYFMPEVLVSARAMKASLAVLRPLIAQGGAPPAGRVVIGTVKGDLHDIGKNMVAMMFEGAGFEVIDLGTDVSPAAFAQAVEDRGAHLVGLSALLTTTMPMMGATIAELGRRELRGRVKVMVGGAPLSQAFAEQIGADGYAPDSASAVELARALLALPG